LARGRKRFLAYETTISTIKNPAQTATRIPRAQGNPGRTRRVAQSPPTRSQTPDPGLIAEMTADLPKRLRLKRESRLAQSREFARVRQQGERLAQGCLIANWNRLPEGDRPRLGVVTGRKIGGAVARSRARRLLRESFRLHQHEFVEPVELILVARNSIVGKRLGDVERDFLTALNRAGLRKNG
jgi:ribonuclease P protein component